MKSRILLSLVSICLLGSCGGDGEKSKSADTPKKEAVAPKVDDIAAGEKTFRTYCITCHGIDGKLGLNGAKDLAVSEVTLEDRITQVTKGKGLMTPFEGILSEEQISQVAKYTMTLKAE